MATLLLTTVGTALGGPLGGAIGAFAGRALDNEILGSGGREGPRLDELTVSTSSYGTAIPRHFGAMRSAGSIIWATELSESSETSGRKGQPKTTTFSYSTSFAVAVSSRPIIGIGRIWANGAILRDANGALAVDGMVRIHNGYGDQVPDELILSQEGPEAPAFRGLAYVMFESLQLAEFGNRIPALTFEVIADDGPLKIQDIISPASSHTISQMELPQLASFSDNGGPIRQTLEVLDTLFPLVAKPSDEVLQIEAGALFTASVYTLPDAISGPSDSDFGSLTGLSSNREISREASSRTVRYYDIDRDYLSSVQRTNGRAATAGTELVQFPGALTPNNAKKLIESRRLRSVGTQAGMQWRIAEIDPDLQPGSVVQIPGQSGKWSIQSSEWRENGIELELIRLLPNPSDSGLGDAGVIARSANLTISPTVLRAFELPWDGNGSPSQRTVFVAGSGSGNNAGTTWNGAALFSEIAGKLDPIGKASPAQAIGGILTTVLKPSASLLFEPGSALAVTVHNAEMIFAPTTLDGLGRGDNTVLVGSELLQFASAEQTSERDWILRGLLRGRGGTEPEARTAHPSGTQITLVDRNLTMLDSSAFNPASVERLAAIGKGDTQPASVEIENFGLSLKPLTPVHGQLVHHDDGGVTACWIRRTRGAWQWLDGVDSPLNEEQELYCVSVGSPIAPDFAWQTEKTWLELPSESVSSFAGLSLWVQQVGARAKSAPLYLGTLL